MIMKYIKKTVFLLAIIIAIIFAINHPNQNRESGEKIVPLKNIELNGKRVSVLKTITIDSEDIILKDGSNENTIYELKKKDVIPEDYIDLFPFKGTKEDYIILITKWNADPTQEEGDEGYTIFILTKEGENLNKDDKLIWFGKWLNESESIDDYLPYNDTTKNKILLELNKLKNKGKL